MCVISAIGDNWRKTVPESYPWVNPSPAPRPFAPDSIYRQHPTRAEFEALKREMEELKKLLVAAKEFDEKTGQPDCHADEKVELIKRLAEVVGVDLGEIFGKTE